MSNNRQEKERLVVKLADREIPRNKNGDPEFKDLLSLQKVFNEQEIAALVNRQLYQMEYQRIVHKDRAAREREVMKPVKAYAKSKFGVSWIKLTDEQIEEAVRAVQAGWEEKA